MQIETTNGTVAFGLIITIKNSKDNFLVAFFNSEHHMTQKFTKVSKYFRSDFETIFIRRIQRRLVKKLVD